jgi:tetratricopeptide (TPR) repeat protein
MTLSKYGHQELFRICLCSLLVVAAGLLAYHNSLTGAFVFDERTSIVENPTIRHLWPIWPVLSPPREGGTTVRGRPLVNLSFAVNYALGGTEVRGYHALNLTIHLLAGLTLLGIVRRTLLQSRLRARFGSVALPLALATAVIWTVHPLQTEAVTYVVQRAESMMGLFYLLALYCFIRGAESRLSNIWYGLSVAACVLGMACKEVMVTAPVMILLYDRTFVSQSFREAWRRRWPLYLGLATTWVLLGYLVISSGNRGGSVGFGLDIAWWTYGLTQFEAIVDYLRLVVWPHPLVFDYGTRLASSAAEVWPYALITGVLIVGTVVALRRSPAIGFLGAWFFVILAPTSSIVPVATQTMAEHRMYLPLAATLVLVVMGVHALAGRRSIVVFIVIATGLGFLTARRNEDYQSELTLWGDTVAKWPENRRAQINLGLALVKAGRLPEAIQHYEQALQINSSDAEAHNNLANALFQMGSVRAAIEHYEQALRIRPNDSGVCNNLGNALMRAGNIPAAMERYEQALRISPNDAVVHHNLGSALMQSGNVEAAIEHYERALHIAPEYAEAHNNLAKALFRAGKIQEAIGHFEQALRIQPDSAEIHNNLGIVLARQGKLVDAQRQFERAVALDPGLEAARHALDDLRQRTEH